MTEQDRPTERSPKPGVAVAVAAVLALFIAVLWPGESREVSPEENLPSLLSAPEPQPTEEPEPEETLTEYVLPPVCEDVILVNEMLVVAAQDTYSQALDAVLEKDVKGIKKATEALDAYRGLLTEVSKTYEEDREECMGTKSDSDLLKEQAEKLLEDDK